MKTPKALSERLLRSSGELATRATTCRRIAGGLGRVEVTGLELSDQEVLVLKKARDLLESIAITYAKASKLKKAAEEAHQQRRKDVRAAMKDNFEALATTADKVAAIATVKGFMLAPGGLSLDKPSDATYLVGEYFRQSLDDIGYGIASASAGDFKDLAPAAAVALAWQRFQDRREQLQDKYAQVIVLAERLASEMSR